MGLDMYLRAKTTKRNYEGPTGACSGMFPLAPDDEGMVEIGYWRKAYDQQDLICEVIASYDCEDDCCNNMIITLQEINTILTEANRILKEHIFNEDGDDLSSKDTYTFNCKHKWEDTVKFFTEALNILNEDPQAEIYYCQWY